MFSISVFALRGLWQREYLVDKTAWWTGTNVKMKIQHSVSLIISETGMVLQDKLGQVVDEINLVPEISKFVPFRRNFFCSLRPRITDASKPLKALCHTFYGQRLLFWVNGLIQLGHSLSGQPEMWPCPAIDHCGFSLQFLYTKYAQLVTPPAPISLNFFFFSLGFLYFWSYKWNVRS